MPDGHRCALSANALREDATQDEVLATLRSSRTQLALVRSIDGHRVVGIVTLEDVLEELVGEIRDAAHQDDTAGAT